jgi:tRNA-splicing ligase RtcB
MITGKTLIDLGYKPSKWFKNVIDHVNTNLEKFSSTESIKTYVESVIPKVTEPYSKPINFHQNIEADSIDEQNNINSVISSMNNILTVPTIVDAAIMPDACPTGPNDIPVGAIVVSKNAIHPSMHSADICCSMMATDLGFTSPSVVLEAAFKITHFGAGGRSLNNRWLTSDLKDKIMNNYYLNNTKSINLAEYHLGTQGDGNHFLFVGIRESDNHTIMVTHHGSRGFGANLYKEGLYKAEQFRKELSPNSNSKHPWIPFDTKEGEDYWEALQITREWTKFNHQVIHSLVSTQVFKSIDVNSFWNEHNFVFKKDDLFYHAKGATPLDDNFVPDSTNGLRLIPMNMRDGVLIVKGETTPTNLGFANHGAGRLMSRTEYSKKALVNKTGHELFLEETSGLDIRFFSGKMDISELPGAYKSSEKVQKQMKQFGLGEVIDLIKPYGCIMCGHDKGNWRDRKKKL